VDVFKALILGIVQGVTEFVPVSSSGHLVIVPWLAGWPSPGLLFDTIVHWGTLSALIVAYWSDILNLGRSWLRVVLRRPLASDESAASRRQDARLVWWIIIGTVPAAVAGALLEEWFESMFANPRIAGGLLLVTAALLILSERLGTKSKRLEQMRPADAVLIGLAQAAAIAPGISRSGTTISAGLLCGIRRDQAARYAFLLSIPIVVGAGLFKLWGLRGAPLVGETWMALGVGFVASAASGILALRFLRQYLQKRPLYPFAAYCALLGCTTLVLTFVR
jgi:undecaprenyl-diphosphatase